MEEGDTFGAYNDDDSFGYGAGAYSYDSDDSANEGSYKSDNDADGPYEYSDEIRFENEYNIHERVGGYLQHNVLGELGTTEGDVDLRDPVQRFTQFTKTVANEMINQGVIGLKRADVYYIIDQIKFIPHTKYKNPTAFVLGFWVTTRDGGIDRDKLKALSPRLSTLSYPVRDYDVIRYSRLWSRLNLYDRDR